MRTYQLSAVLVSAAMLLSGCYLGRDRGRLEQEWGMANNCRVSGGVIAAETVVAALSMVVGVFAWQVTDRVGPPVGAVIPFAALTGLFGADAMAGYSMAKGCAEARASWRFR
jgi:hypothetical protein